MWSNSGKIGFKQGLRKPKRTGRQRGHGSRRCRSGDVTALAQQVLPAHEDHRDAQRAQVFPNFLTVVGTPLVRNQLESPGADRGVELLKESRIRSSCPASTMVEASGIWVAPINRRISAQVSVDSGMPFGDCSSRIGVGNLGTVEQHLERWQSIDAFKS